MRDVLGWQQKHLDCDPKPFVRLQQFVDFRLWPATQAPAAIQTTGAWAYSRRGTPMIGGTPP